MPRIHINKEKITPQAAEQLMSICPFGAFDYEAGGLSINAACKMCRLCVKNGPKGAVEYVEDTDQSQVAVDKTKWQGIAVFAEQLQGEISPVTFELLGKARELAGEISQPVYALLIGSGMEKAAETLRCYGADKVFVYDAPKLEHFLVSPYAAAFEDFIRRVKPGSILIGASNLGRSLAPRIAARFGTGLTADCTRLEIKENTDLVQIRPAFGGSIMAQIVTPRHRPQMCTVRYKIFSAPEKTAPKGEVVQMETDKLNLNSGVEVQSIQPKAQETDISEADTIVAVGRGIKAEKDLELVRRLALALNAQIACTRPLIENGWFDAKKQIGLSGRTVKPKLIVAIGISGAVQFTAGMSSSDCIIAVNSDKNAGIFDIAHYGLVGDLYEILPTLLDKIEALKGGAAL